MFANIFKSLFRRGAAESDKGLGQRGEAAARDFLKKRLYKILECNWRTKIGELDFVAIKDNLLVIVEVKTSKKRGSVPPELRVNGKKQKKIKQLAQLYIKSKHIALPVRFDVIGVWWEEELKIKHIENAFV